MRNGHIKSNLYSTVINYTELKRQKQTNEKNCKHRFAVTFFLYFKKYASFSLK